MNSQNNELRNQNMEFRNQVSHYRMEVDRLEKKLDKFRKKADMSDLIARLTNHSISRPPAVSEVTQCMSTLATSEMTPPHTFSSPKIPPPVPDLDSFSQFLAPTVKGTVPGGSVQNGVTRICPDGTEIWYPGDEMPTDYQLKVLSRNWFPDGVSLDELENMEPRFDGVGSNFKDVGMLF